MTHKAVREAWDLGKGGWVDRGAFMMLKACENVCVPVNLENVMYVPALVNFCLYQLKRSRRLACLCLCESCV